MRARSRIARARREIFLNTAERGRLINSRSYVYRQRNARNISSSRIREWMQFVRVLQKFYSSRCAPSCLRLILEFVAEYLEFLLSLFLLAISFSLFINVRKILDFIWRYLYSDLLFYTCFSGRVSMRGIVVEFFLLTLVCVIA